MKLRTLKDVAAYINGPDNGHHFGLKATTERGYCNTDRKPRGFRYITHVGKGRYGTRIKIYTDHDYQDSTKLRCKVCGKAEIDHSQLNAMGLKRPVLDHNNAETYRCTREVVEWLENWLGRKLS